ncbi:phosphoketolase family protein [Candidatus Peregrinibacteria bacterium]|jgi:xylulose-5-phosphate/fructose-6-phosphate phosphoketolase|nr:phosphoketolase family protein [Candidatus Peregrinibacteria bacterium]MBT4632049.1 phosphoketolase family protein [Candidatus Peregrinibacteria bacterium]MBT5516396.1 phosphoketolase family protein [Candidatus Peregrinibacteria bacterium]
MPLQDFQARRWLKKYLRYVDYIAAAQLYLQDNFLMEEDLKPEHIKPRVLGHWGTVPGLNFIYAQLNYLIYKHKCEMLFVVGPGHGAPAVLANLFADKSMHDVYPEYTLDGKGMGKIIKDFSWPHSKFPSHVTPTVPGSILEGGELGYSLATAYGAAMDNPNLIVAAVIGDGESETGPIATAWHSNKFFNPKTSGAVLPIVHINGYKISNPTIFGRMDDSELHSLFVGYGYEPHIVSGANLDKKMMHAMEKSYQRIRAVQKKARNGGSVLKPKWPVILLRSPKGWKGVHDFHGHAVEGSFHSHGIPFGKPKSDTEELAVVEKWLKSYKVHKLVDEKGRPKPSLMKYVPGGKLRMGMNKHTIGGNMLKELKFPNMKRYEVKFDGRGCKKASSMKTGAKMIRDIYKKNPRNFRLYCPDEVESNKLGAVFEATKRAFMWPTEKNDENMDPEGRVMEMLSEHTLQAWYMGYLLTGRHGIFVSYEAFTTIINSMVDQYAKFLKQSFKVSWRTPVASAVYINSSVGWRQDHNGYSHQNPSFVSGVLQKHGEFCQVYYPPDANSMLVALEETLSSKDKICVIVAGKRDLPQWLTLKEAREQAKHGLGIWEWVCGKKASKNPDVVLASAGDYITQEALYAVQLCHELVPEMKIRYVNVSELTSLCLGDYCKRDGKCMDRRGVEKFFTKNKPVVFSYHGYVNDIEQILWPYVDSDRFSIHGYREEGTTTTPFDMKVANKVSFYHLAIDMIEQVAKTDKKMARRKPALLKEINKRIRAHQDHICKFGDDPEDVKAMCWGEK